MSDVPPPPGSMDPPIPPPPPVSSPPTASSPPPPPPSNLTRPPGYVSYANNPTPVAATKRVGGLAKAIMVLTGVVAVGTVGGTIASAAVTQDATDFLRGQLSEDEFENAIAPLTTIQLVTGLATVAAGVITIIWMYRIARNVRAHGRQTAWSPLFAIFGWVLPPMILYIIPFLVLRELWKASEPTPQNGSDTWKKSADNPLLWVWLVVFGILPAVILAIQVGALTSGGLPTGNLDSVADSLEDFGALAFAGAGINVVAAVVWVSFVSGLTKRHRSLTGEN